LASLIASRRLRDGKDIEVGSTVYPAAGNSCVSVTAETNPRFLRGPRTKNGLPRVANLLEVRVRRQRHLSAMLKEKVSCTKNKKHSVEKT